MKPAAVAQPPGASRAQVERYYSEPRSVGETTQTIYEIWERGGAYADSVTPATYCPAYRAHIVELLVAESARGDRVLSLGCGNGVVEHDLTGHGRAVRAMDCNDEAVRLTRAKGVDAFTGDVFDLGPADVAGVRVVYADGLLGHLFDAEDGLAPVLDHLAALGLPAGATLVLSNDAPPEPGRPFAPHPHVEGFWLVSRDHLEGALANAGFIRSRSHYFEYERPLSGARNRTIAIATVL